MIKWEFPEPTSCASSGTYDNDDANFTAVSPLANIQWGLRASDGAEAYAKNISRLKNVTAFAEWNKPLGTSYTYIYNSPVIDENRTFSPSGNWTNYTMNLLNTTDFPRASNVYVMTMCANDTYEQGACTSGSWKNFYLWSTANVTSIGLSSNITYNGTSVLVGCRVADGYSDAYLFDSGSGYNVSFFNSTSYLGSNVTDYSGWAMLNYTDNAQSLPKSETIRCNITSMPARYYNASPISFEKSTTLQVVDLRVNLDTVNSTPFGANATIRANITGNASAIYSVWANITFYNFSSGTYASESVPMSPYATYSSTNTGYTASYPTKRSGLANATIHATAGARSSENRTSFNVGYGAATLNFTFPNYRILVNQSFNFTVYLGASSGDILSPALTINFTNGSVMNVSMGQSVTQQFAVNLTNGSLLRVAWNVSTLFADSVRASVNATLAQGTSLFSDAPFSVLVPIVSAENATISITQNETLVAKVIGNTSSIQSVNFTVAKPYGGGSNVVVGSLSEVMEESECIGTGTGVGNVALNATASCSGGTCANAIDGNNGTSWTRYVPNSWITINLSANYTIETIALLWEGGATNTSAFYKRYSSSAMEMSENGGFAWLPMAEFQNMDAPNEPNTTTVKVTYPFTTDTIMFNDSASGYSIYEIRLFPIEDKKDKCYVFRANYTSVNSSGTHGVASSAKTGNSMWPASGNSSFFVQFGAPTLKQVSESTQIFGVGDFVYKIFAEGGDLRNMTSNLSISNATVMKLSGGETSSKNTSFVAYGASSEVSWSINATQPGYTNMSLSSNSTLGLGGFASLNSTVEIIMADPIKPEIHWFGISSNVTNMRQAIVATINASDNYLVKSITAEVSGPSFSFNNTNTTDAKPSGLWTVSVNSTLLNETGNYSVRVYASDLNLSNTVFNATLINFTVYDTYSVLPDTNYSAYNRGENMTFRAYDVNGGQVSAVFWIVNETGNGTNSTTIYSGTNSTYLYYVNSTKEPGNYTLKIFVNSSGNLGNYTAEVNLSATLGLVFAQPLPGVLYAPNDAITSPTRPKIMVKNARGESLANMTGAGSVYLHCPGSTSPISLIYEYDAFWGGHLYTTELEKPDKACRVPGTYSTQFNLSVNASDQYNNSGMAYSSELTTGAAPGGPPGNSGGGGGGGPPQNVTQNITYVYNKTMAYNFNFSLDVQEVGILQGKEATVIAAVANTGDFDMGISVSNSETPLYLNYTKSIALEKSADADFPIRVRANLSLAPEDYFVTIYMSGNGISKNRAIKVRVDANPDLAAINTIVAEMAALKADLESYISLGINVTPIKDRIGAAEAYLASAEEASLLGDTDALSASVASAGEEISSAKSELGLYRTQKFLLENKYTIAEGTAAAIIMLYILEIFFLPYTKISRRLYLLRREEKILNGARKASEVQYFMRKINDVAFQKIMADNQEKLYKIKSEAKRLEDELSLLKRLRFGELKRLRNEWKVKMREAEKARMVQSVREAQAANAGMPHKRTNIFIRLLQIIRGLFAKKAENP